MQPLFNTDKSSQQSVSFNDLCETEPSLNVPSDFRAVVVGGGTGSPASIKALRALGVKTDCVVAMADDGGSTGILRKDAGVTPPGDIRKCLCALAEDEEDPLTTAFAYRFTKASNHALGNLILSGLEQASGSFYDAILKCEEILKCAGHVYPSTLENITLSAETFDGLEISGQAVATKSKTALKRVEVLNEKGENPKAFHKATQALKEADLIVLGPGSLFTSIIPNILINGIREAILESNAKVVFVCGIEDIQGETWGLHAYEHVEALENHGMKDRIDFCILNSRDDENGERERELATEELETFSQQRDFSNVELEQTRVIEATEEDINRIKDMGISLILRSMVDKTSSGRHNLFALRDALEYILGLENRDRRLS